MADAVTDRTRLVVAATTTFAPGYRCDLAPLSAACRRHDAFLLVDAVQSVGILHTDVEAMGVDGLAVSTQKGLLGRLRLRLPLLPHGVGRTTRARLPRPIRCRPG